ncbi:MAG TPA: prepilin-type N-terminal cleavage/methylation domain-containing protein [Verrucomicrobiales bacterium]|nr:prepilin-type N-terminal cleavage/methylation domain-containing protein [Verrucomicrobiales bacterium]
MTQTRNSGPPKGPIGRAFTLVEIVVSLTIIAVIAAVAVPTMKGLHRDEKAREPMASLAEVVQEARHRAMRERRSYQIVFEPGGIHASPAMYPYGTKEEFLKHLEELRHPPEPEPMETVAVQRADDEEKDKPKKPDLPWTVTIPLATGTECGVLMWGDGEWDILDGGKMRRWVFQPAGMANPARIRLRNNDGGPELEAGFDVLTGEVTSERSRLVTRQP